MDHLDQSYELPLIHRKLGVMGCHRSAEERDRSTAVVQNRAEPVAESVAIVMKSVVKSGSWRVGP